MTMTTDHPNHTAIVPTPHEKKAMELMAKSLRVPLTRIALVRFPEAGRIYDWADPASGSVGQCWTKHDGSWGQKPLGAEPVIMADTKKLKAALRTANA